MENDICITELCTEKAGQERLAYKACLSCSSYILRIHLRSVSVQHYRGTIYNEYMQMHVHGA